MSKKTLVMVPIEKLQISNRQLNIEKMMKIQAQFTWDLFGVIPVYPNTKGRYIITDGNHRVSALRNRMKPGMKIYVPCVLLTRKEYDYVKFSDRDLQIQVYGLENPQIMD